MLKQWQLGDTSLKIEGGESPNDVVARMAPAMEHISAADGRKDDSDLHARTRYPHIDVPPAALPTQEHGLFEHENLCLYLLHHTGSMFTVDGITTAITCAR